MTRTRRSVLTAAATLIGAGCTGVPTSGTDRTTTTTTSPETAPATVESIAITPEVVARNSPDTLGVYGRRSQQYVIATLSVDGSPPPGLDRIRLETDDDTRAPDSNVGGMGGELWTYGPPYGDDGDGWVAYTVPKPVATETATLTTPGNEHPVPPDQVIRLNRPPTTFTVDAVTLPDTIAADESATLEVMVTNDGAVPGTWVAAVNRSGPRVAYTPETALRQSIPAAETRTVSYTNTVDERIGTEPTGTMDFRVEWRDGGADRSVEITAP